MRHIPVQTYISVFLITLLVIGGAFYASAYINNQKTNAIKADENKIAIDIFALEAKTDLLKESECSTLDTTLLPKELSNLSSRINFMEKQVGDDDSTIFRLKRYFALLEIKSYIINQKLAKRCAQNMPTIIYLYKNGTQCDECAQEEYVLEALQRKRPDVSFYSLDYNNDFSALRTYTSIQALPDKLPTMIVNGKTYSGFVSLAELEKLIDPQIIVPLKK